jgi:hypothetical protein
MSWWVIQSIRLKNGELEPEKMIGPFVSKEVAERYIKQALLPEDRKLELCER